MGCRCASKAQIAPYNLDGKDSIVEEPQLQTYTTMRIFLPLMTILLPALLAASAPVSKGSEDTVVQTFEMRNGIAVRAGPPDVMDIFKQLHIFDSRVAETFTSRYANWKSLSSRLDRALASGTEHMNDEEFAEVRQLILDTDQAKMSLQAIIDHMYGFLPNYLRPKLPGL